MISTLFWATKHLVSTVAGREDRWEHRVTESQRVHVAVI